MREIALKYHSYCLSVIPVANAEKQPLGKWTKSMKQPVEPGDNFDTAFGIGIVCGEASQGVEVLDIDLKHDLTKTLWDRFKKAAGPILKKLVIEQTPSGGFHLIYRCEELEGNKKLAMRYATDAERSENPNRRQETLIETRGKGGFFMCAPSPGYVLKQGSFDQIPFITVSEREDLFAAAKAFNEIYAEEPKPKPYYQDSNPFDEYNDKADVQLLLQQNGWEYVQDAGDNMMFKRPGSEHKYSAGLHKTKRLFYVFSSSTVFDPQKAYNPSQVLCKLNFNGDWSACVDWLKNNGYGRGTKKITDVRRKEELTVNTITMKDKLTLIRNGGLIMGLQLGIKRLDSHWRFKEKHLVMFNGIDNVGKSAMVWYLMVLCAKKHDKKFIIYSGENSVEYVMWKMCEFYIGQDLKTMAPEDFDKAYEWVTKHFKFIEQTDIFTIDNLLEIATDFLKETSYFGLYIDPYNSLIKAVKHAQNDHSYDLDAMTRVRFWIKKYHVSVFIVNHVSTEAARKVHPKGHKFEGLTMPPGKADTEGGQKFANKADDFLTIHRYTKSKTEWMWSEIHIQKNKENETGGKQTSFDEPIKMNMNYGSCGFTDESGYDPILELYLNDGIATTEPILDEETYGKKINDGAEENDMPF